MQMEHANIEDLIEKVEAVAKMCSVKKVFLEISKNSQENTCARVCNSMKLEAVPHVFCSVVKKKCSTYITFHCHRIDKEYVFV